MFAGVQGIEASGTAGSEIEYDGLFTWDMYLVAVSIMACAAVVPGYGFPGGESAGTVTGEDMADVPAYASWTSSQDIGRCGTQSGPHPGVEPLRGCPDTNQNPSDVFEQFSSSTAFTDNCGLFPAGPVPVQTVYISLEEMEMSKIMMPSGYMDMSATDIEYNDGGFGGITFLGILVGCALIIPGFSLLGRSLLATLGGTGLIAAGIGAVAGGVYCDMHYSGDEHD